MNTLRDYVNWKLTHSDKTAEAEGYPLVMEKCKKNKEMKDLKVYGDSVCRKVENLYSADMTYLKDSGWCLSRDALIITDYSITTYAIADATEGNLSIYLHNVTDYAGKTICMSFVPETETVKAKWTGLVLYDSSGSTVESPTSVKLEDGSYYSTISIPEGIDDTYTLRIRLYGQNLTKGCEVKISNIMMCEGSEPPLSKISPEDPIEVQSVGKKTINLYNHSVAEAMVSWNMSKTNAVFGSGAITSYVIGDSTGGFLLVKVGNAADYIGKSISCTWKPVTENVKTSVTAICIYNANNEKVKETSSKEVDGNYFHCALSIPDTVADTDNLIFRLYSGNSKNNDPIAVEEIMVYEGTEPLPYEPYDKYKVPIVQKGKNLFNPLTVSASSTSNISVGYPANSSGTIIDSTDLRDNTVTIKEVVNDEGAAIEAYQNGYFVILHDCLTEGKQYILSFDIDIHSNPRNANKIRILPGGQYPVYDTTFSKNKQRVSFTFTEKRHPDTKRVPYMEIRCMTMTFTASNFMITEVGCDTDFEPYAEPQVHNVFLDEPLRKIGDYADYIDFKNQSVVRNTGNEIFNGTEDWKYEKLSYGNNFYVNIPDAYPDRNVRVMCNMGSWISWTMSNPYNIRISELGNFNFRYEDYDNLTDFKNKLSEMYLNNQPLSVNYVLKTETSKDISNQLPKITEKTTIFTVDSKIKPSNMYGKYIK